MPNNLYINKYKISINIDNINKYETIERNFLNLDFNQEKNNNFEENFFNKKYFIKKNVLNQYQHYFSRLEQKIIFIKLDNSEIFYEDFEEFLKTFNMKFDVFDKKEINSYLSSSLLELNVNSVFFLVPEDRKFLINIEGENFILTPIKNEILKNEESLKSYYQKLFQLIISSLDGFIRSRVRIIENRIIINYHDAIDQFFYIIKQIVNSKILFNQSFDQKKYINDLLHFIVKSIANSELNALKSGIECSENHPLNKYRHLTLITYKLFSKIVHVNGNLTMLSQNDILQLSDAFLYENVFENAPLFISNVYNKLCKIMPFKVLERIIKKQKINEYQL